MMAIIRIFPTELIMISTLIEKKRLQDLILLKVTLRSHFVGLKVICKISGHHSLPLTLRPLIH